MQTVGLPKVPVETMSYGKTMHGFQICIQIYLFIPFCSHFEVALPKDLHPRTLRGHLKISINESPIPVPRPQLFVLETNVTYGSWV